MNHEPRTRTTLPPVRPTPRQLEILAAIVRHGAYKPAAHELGIAHGTVKWTAAVIRDRLGVYDTVQSVWACRDLLEPLV